MTNPLSSLKKHRLLSKSNMPHREEERVDSATNERPSSVETRIRVPKEPATEKSGSPNMSNEPLVQDFHTSHVQPTSRKNSVSKPISIQIVAPEKELPSSPSFFQENTDDDDEAPAPPDFLTRARGPGRSSHAPQHTAPPEAKSSRRLRDSGSYTATSSLPTTPDSRDRTSMDSDFSQDTHATSIHTLPPLQSQGYLEECDRLEPVMEDDPANFDLVAAPPEEVTGVFQLETQAEKIFSREHLEFIFADRKSLLKFTGFLNSYRPRSIPLLMFLLDAMKALRAIKYANAIAEALDPIPGYDFTDNPPRSTQNQELQAKADHAFDLLVREDLPAYIAHTWIQVASVSISRRVTGTLAPHLREASEGLAEVFCLSDPSRKDNPIVFASEEFHRTTQYGMSYSIGRNCRFLQGPKTSPYSVRRLAEACKAQKEHSEIFVNYRRDGSPFMNLLMIAPLFDSRGTLRYYIGAQVDVSGLLKEGTGFEAMSHLMEHSEKSGKSGEDDRHQKDVFQDLSDMFNTTELETVRQSGGRMHREQFDDDDRDSIMSSRPRLLLKDPSSELLDRSKAPTFPSATPIRQNGKLEGVYQHYLLVRPAPSLRILFTSPSLRVPGILQSPFLSRIGGSSRVRNDLAQALGEGRGVTAKIRWLTRLGADGEDEGRSRWIHCTPLLGHSGEVGVWMVVLVDEEGSVAGQSRRRYKQAPPVSLVIGGKEYDARAMKDKSEQEQTKVEMMVPDSQSQRGVGASDMARPGTGDMARPGTGSSKAQRGPPSSNWSARGSANMSDYSFALK